MNPYKDLPDKAFWRLSVSSKNMLDIDDLWNPKFNIRQTQPIATFGSCFAQHIGSALKAFGYRWLITEPPPYGLSKKNAKLFGYNMFSARTGNIYSTSLLKQWTEWALDRSAPPDELWEKDGRFYDPFRPTIEPNGFESESEMRSSRAQAIVSFRSCIMRATYFVFTLGLTESWFNQERGYEYPMCPGTAGGVFNPKVHVFRNQQFQDIIVNLAAAIELMRGHNKSLRFLLTVSPVPLVATKSGNHVLVATMESKSVLRAVAGQLARNRTYIDYFPSYEIINSPVFRGTFYEPNQRGINHHGVTFVMNVFFSCLSRTFAEAKGGAVHKDGESQIGAACDEELLDAFGGKVG
jgi:GSCFA family